MDPKELYFKGQNPGEEVIAFCRQHWLAILPNILFFIVDLTVFIFLNFYLFIYHDFFGVPALSFHVFITFIFLLHLHYFFKKLIDYFQHLYIFTSGRFMEVISDNVNVIDLWTVQEIQKFQDNFLKRFLNFGELNFLNVKVVKLLPNPTYYFDLVTKVKIGGRGEADRVKDKIPSIEASEENSEDGAVKPAQNLTITKSTINIPQTAPVKEVENTAIKSSI